ncbi:MAG: beta-galactosidase trimerization domain-containing protein [Firmicutes bacterium]|nr:beta-galactosidase trimerization domain-containing protein [Bacillota bacterium]
MEELPFRQIHLDFHTSPDIPGIAEAFDPEEFAETLARAHVNSVTCFARDHHGMIYYASQKFPERIHPHLKHRNLLQEQIDACHRRGIRVPIYITVQWDHYTAEHHPEWLAIDDKGRIIGTPPYEPGFYRHLCVNTGYRDFLKVHTQEVLETIHGVDGLFFDIVQTRECSCPECRAAMRRRGLDPSQPDARWQFAQEMMAEFKAEMTQWVRQWNSECSIFYNRGHVGVAERAVRTHYTHFELESLPSGGWGYLHFPTAMRYARTLGLECAGQTGKFHTSWGDFHSFKNQAALEFECFTMLSLGAKCIVGDQLEPHGRLSNAVYDLIGSVYAQVEAVEPWCRKVQPLSDIAVMTTEPWFPEDRGLTPEMRGVVRILTEGGHQFDIVDPEADLTGYRVVILPDRVPVNESLATKLTRYHAQGGAILASFESGLASGEFSRAVLGVIREGEAPYSPDYLLPRGHLGRGLPETEHVMYQRGVQVRVEPGFDIACETIIPYFNRTWEHFCSHRHTPSSGRPGYPGVVTGPGTVYFAHPVFSQYCRISRFLSKAVSRSLSREREPQAEPPGFSPGARAWRLRERITRGRAPIPVPPWQ